MSDSYEYFKNKKSNRIYLSRSLGQKLFRKDEAGQVQELIRPFRIVSKVVDCAESHQFIKDGKQVSLRITTGGRQEIIAKFYEDARDISTLTIQRFTIESGAPHKTYFTFSNSEIVTLYNFIRNIEILPIRDEHGARLDDKFVSDIALTHEQALGLLASQPELIEELLKTQVSARDVAELGYRREQLAEFARLLADDGHFEDRRRQLGANKGPESVWQSFFEHNTWIFGYGLNYVLNSPLDGAKLETAIRGHDIIGAGKRVDALLKTQGLISALSFGEIKTHKATLLKSVAQPYRKECWQISDELAGGIAQVQRSVQTSLTNIRTRADLKGEDGAPAGETVFLYRPRSFLIIGSLSEFRAIHGINEEKYSSFELFRRNLAAPEVVTFDELYERAKYIVEAAAIR